MPNMILYYFEPCPFCQKVLLVIDELHLDEKIEFRDTLEQPQFRDELVQLNGKTQVPCLVINGEPMLESDDIIAYLKENYG